MLEGTLPAWHERTKARRMAALPALKLSLGGERKTGAIA